MDVENRDFSFMMQYNTTPELVEKETVWSSVSFIPNWPEPRNHVVEPNPMASMNVCGVDLDLAAINGYAKSMPSINRK